ncbi:MAG: amylo-alpha-1,6-glucosidase [Actinomycetota bacterium]|nr:amylo-alpha-1,6-glucosidase [Actinomycetota bacterium]MDQ2957251.1 amylo-alpha-1,6-glucosidase [Actinomycetota bacterium]
MTQQPARQPYLHDLLACVRAPALALSGRDGQLDPDRAGAGQSVEGIYLADRRIIATALLSVTGAELNPVLGEFAGASGTRSLSIARGLGNPGPDPTVWVQRWRELDGAQATESIEFSSAARGPVSTRLTLTLGSDLAEMSTVKAGQPTAPLQPEAIDGGLSWTGPDGARVTATAKPAPDTIEAGRLSWNIELAQGESVLIELSYRLDNDPRPQVVALPVGESSVRAPRVSAGDLRLPQLLDRSLADLRALELADPVAPTDRFIAAGVPWFLTLFGRDSLLTARMLLPLGTELAAGTLRTLARRQGGRVDPESAEEPGKILHEIRRVETDHGDGGHADQQLRLPPTYYGTVDATALWISLLHDGWRWGMPIGEVAALLPNLERALAWMRDYGMDDSGFLRYADRSGHGLANQGWKDSHDSIQFADGRLADAPVALSEVQAYAYAAARHGADLLDAFGRPGGQEWRDWAEELAVRFRRHFWLTDPAGDYPAMALDAAGRPVDALASNMGHLLGTGLLDQAESELVARRLGSPELSSGFGLRTMASSAAGFNPLSYHGGSVWTHDTAIAITGLATAATNGVPAAAEAAAGLITGLLSAAPTFEYRMPELHGGERISAGGRATPYPASCRPQAWAAAASVAILSAVLGPRPDAPAGRLDFAPLRPSPVGELSVRGLRFAGRPMDVTLSVDGAVSAG